jgi:organic hydroperoxide reductase OsmC/OhrA
MNLEHGYTVSARWLGNRGSGTSGYRDYGREGVVETPGTTPIETSSDTVFHGDAERWNPEELLVAALSECHRLSYLHAAASAGVVVVGYEDDASGRMRQDGDGGGHFTDVTLRPRVTVADPGMVETATALHERAASMCFIAASVNFPVGHEPVTLSA